MKGHEWCGAGLERDWKLMWTCIYRDWTDDYREEGARRGMGRRPGRVVAADRIGSEE